MTFSLNNYKCRFLGSGLFTIPDYDTWKPRRRLYDSAFKKSYLEGILPAFNDSVDLFIEKLRPSADGVTPVLMKQHLSEVTMDVISKVREKQQSLYNQSYLYLFLLYRLLLGLISLRVTLLRVWDCRNLRKIKLSLFLSKIVLEEFKIV